MNKPCLIISDLHLQDSRPDITRTLLHFLEQHSGKCQALYILGDLFEAWIGDDEVTPLAAEVADALSAFHSAGSQVYLLHGNRDFLIGDQYASQCGAQLIEEPFVLQSGNEQYLLLHGDVLCTDDREYMKFRAMVREPAWQQEFLAQPLPARRAFAAQARQQSQAATAEKAQEIMDVNADAVLDLIRSTQQTRIIHGHTHRPAVHQISLTSTEPGDSQATRMVLGDWDSQAWYVEILGADASLNHFPLFAGQL